MYEYLFIFFTYCHFKMVTSSPVSLSFTVCPLLNLLFEFLKSTPLFSSNLIITYYLLNHLLLMYEGFSVTIKLLDIVLRCDSFLLNSHCVTLFKKWGVILSNYKAKKSNLKALLSKNSMNLKSLEKSTHIPLEQLNGYMSKKVMNLSTAMTISKELNCQIEDLYDWELEEKI